VILILAVRVSSRNYCKTLVREDVARVLSYVNSPLLSSGGDKY
jgi:hypothetical protein